MFIISLWTALSKPGNSNPVYFRGLKRYLPTHIFTENLFILMMTQNDDSIRDLSFKGYTIVFRITNTEIEVFGFVKYQNKPTD